MRLFLHWKALYTHYDLNSYVILESLRNKNTLNNEISVCEYNYLRPPFKNYF